MPIQFGLIGYPLTHSFSQKYFTDKFERLGLNDHSYSLFEMQDLSGFNNFVMAHPHLKGLNVTIPHKKGILELLDDCDSEAKTVGAVNTIKILRSGNTVKLKGFNTDIYGFERSIKPFLEMQHNTALILGNGGAALAVKFVLDKLGIRYFVVTRNPTEKFHCSYADLNQYMIKHHLLVINTTPLGMYPQIENSPQFPYEFLTPDHFCIDLVYNPEETLFLKKAKQNGAKTMNGLSMLYLQADKAWEIWSNG